MHLILVDQGSSNEKKVKSELRNAFSSADTPSSIIIHVYPQPFHQPRNFLFQTSNSRPILHESSDWLPLGPIICRSKK
ncbi:uncharacterized protein Bfra_004773 [Botrytis fragariae]|uniref:Uncharacterized protein n=1 Tax=Botrytis fragariae TaxID=1964551 RepID=A0A8H6EK31_9HELO|nr:uncharacterized protein Bfra_004773 [Botrytis fragariae]KAF5874755.1 hypothetical protein Bfra_004773 [Botrytis fragariae]